MRRTVIGSLLLGIVSTAAAPAFAQQGRAPRFEVSASVAAVAPRQDGTYSTSFTPPLGPFERTGNAGQTITLGAESTHGVSIAGAYFPHRSAGFQVIFNRFDSTYSGASSPYVANLQYVSFPPPGFEPSEVVIERSQAWPDAEGSFSNRSLSFNAALRADLGAVVLQASGGPSVFRTSGDARSLGYTKFWLGGHSVLFSEDHEIEVAIEPRTTWGFNAGGDLTVPLAGHFAIGLDGRYFYAPTSEPAVEVTRVLNLDRLINPDPIDVIAQRMNLQPVTIDASFFRLGVGVKLRW